MPSAGPMTQRLRGSATPTAEKVVSAVGGVQVECAWFLGIEAIVREPHLLLVGHRLAFDGALFQYDLYNLRGQCWIKNK